MPERKPYVGDIGTIINVDMQQDISTATNLKFYVRKPDFTVVEWTPTIYGTQILRYITVDENDFDMPGDYYITPYLTLGSWTGSGDTVQFKVYARYQ